MIRIMRYHNRDRNKQAIRGVSLTTGLGNVKLRRQEKILQFIRDVIEILTESQSLFPPLQNLLGQFMITVATIFGLVYVFRLLTR
jgi:hypothetical protein